MSSNDLYENLLLQLSIDPLAVGLKALPQNYFADRLCPQIPLSCLTAQYSKLKGFTFYALTGATPGAIEDDAIGISILPDKICFAVAIIDLEEFFRVHAKSQKIGFDPKEVFRVNTVQKEIGTQLFTECFAHSKLVVHDYFGVTAKAPCAFINKPRGCTNAKCTLYHGRRGEGKFLGRSLRTLPAELKKWNPGFSWDSARPGVVCLVTVPLEEATKLPKWEVLHDVKIASFTNAFIQLSEPRITEELVNAAISQGADEATSVVHEHIRLFKRFCETLAFDHSFSKKTEEASSSCTSMTPIRTYESKIGSAFGNIQSPNTPQFNEETQKFEQSTNRHFQSLHRFLTEVTVEYFNATAKKFLPDGLKDTLLTVRYALPTTTSSDAATAVAKDTTVTWLTQQHLEPLFDPTLSVFQCMDTAHGLSQRMIMDDLRDSCQCVMSSLNAFSSRALKGVFLHTKFSSPLRDFLCLYNLTQLSRAVRNADALSPLPDHELDSVSLRFKTLLDLEDKKRRLLDSSNQKRSTTLGYTELYCQSVLNNAQGLIQHDRLFDALEALHTLITSRHRSIQGHNKHLEEAMYMHVELSVKLRREAHIRAAMHSYRTRVMHLNTSVFGEILEFLEVQLQRIVVDAVTIIATPSIEDTIVLQMTGRSAQASIAARKLEQAFHFVVEATKASLSSINNVGKFETYFQTFSRSVLELCVTHKRTFEFNQVSEFLRKHLLRAFDDQDQRTVVLNAPDVVRSILLTKQEQLKAAAALRHWPAVLNTIDAMRDIMALLRRCKKPIMLQDIIPFFASLTEIFHDTGNLHFFAHFAIYHARLSIRQDYQSSEVPLLASRAVLAAACVREEVDDTTSDRLLHLTKAFALTSVPSRTSLLEDISRPFLNGLSLLELSLEPAKVIHNNLLRQSGTGVTAALAALVAAAPALASFKQIVQDAALEAAVFTAAQNASTVNIAHLAENCGIPVDEFQLQIEPIILHSAQLHRRVAAAIDLKEMCVRFSSAIGAGDRIILFAQQLGETVRAAEPPKPIERLPCPRARLAKRLAEERERVIARKLICTQRLERAEERSVQEKKKEEERKKGELCKRQEIEAARLLKMRERQEAALVRKVEDLEAIERRKWVLNALLKKHHNFEVPMSLAQKSDAQFVDEVTRRLTAFRRETELTKESDVRTMNHYELVCRDAEIPKRENYEKETAEKTQQELAARKANMREQHEDDWRQKIETKKRLMRFKEQKEQYENEMRAAMGKTLAGKVAKRNAEQRELDEMKRQKEEAATAAAPKDARAAPRSPRPRDQEEEQPPHRQAAPEPKKEGAPKVVKEWVPKGRKA